jgi:hypothetical protein
MPEFPTRRPTRRGALLAALATLALAAGCANGDRPRPRPSPPGGDGGGRGGGDGAGGVRGGNDCAQRAVTPISSGLGSNGPLAVERTTLPHPTMREEVTVFMPKGSAGARNPVVFFSHGYGPNIWSVYEPLLNHMVSRGAIVVFGVFPLGMSTMQERYSILWSGFDAAVKRLGDRMDLTRVGFVGHSFGGGANPTMAFEGIVNNGWGSRGAFLFELAPWYTYGMSDERFRRFPSHVLHAAQVYQDDKMNDHVMAYDLHRQFRGPVNWLLLVRSDTVQGCKIMAEHMLPARARNATVLQYATLRPLDALMGSAFERNDAARTLQQNLKPSPEGYQPIQVLAQAPSAPPPVKYRFTWDGRMNPRKEGGEATRAQFSQIADPKELPAEDDEEDPQRRGILERWRERR